MKKILLSISIAVMLLSNPQQSFAMKQDDVTSSIENKLNFILEKHSNIADETQRSKYTELLLDYILGDNLNKKIKKHNNLEKSLSNNIVDNIFKIRFNLPFTPTTEELKTIETIKNKNDFPAPDKELEILKDDRPNCLSIRIFSWFFPNQVDKFYQSFGKILQTFVVGNVREEYISKCIYHKYDKNLNKYYISQTLSGHAGWINCIAVLPNGNIVTGSDDNTAKIWDQNNGKCIQTLSGHTNQISCIAVLPNGNIVTGSDDNTAKIWNPTTGNCIQTLRGHTNWIRCIAVLPNGNIITGSQDNIAKIWDQNNGNCIQTLSGHTGSINCIAVLSNDNIITGSDDNTAKIWNPTTGNCIQTLSGHANLITCLAILPNGNIVTGSADNTVKIWNPTTGNCIQTLTWHGNSISRIAALPNGNIVTESFSNTAKIWNPTTGNCIQTLTGHKDLISCLAVLPNGNIVTGSTDKTAKIWDPNIPYMPKIKPMALSLKIIANKNEDKKFTLNSEWQEVFDKLPVSQEIKDDLKIVLDE